MVYNRSMEKDFFRETGNAARYHETPRGSHGAEQLLRIMGMVAHPEKYFEEARESARIEGAADAEASMRLYDANRKRHEANGELSQHLPIHPPQEA